MPELTTTTSSFSYRTWTTAQPSAVMVLLHGFGEHGWHYTRFAHEMNRAGIDVWAIDHIGHGHTAGDPGHFGTLQALADNAAALAQAAMAATPGIPVVYMGHSLGGLVACLLAQRLEPDALVITGAPFDGAPADLPGELVMSLDQSYLEALANDPLGFDTAPAEPALWDAITEGRPAVEAAVDAITSPTLVIYGSRDCFTTAAQARAWTDRFADADLLLFEGFHDIVNDLVHEPLAEAVRNFVIRTTHPSATDATLPTR